MRRRLGHARVAHLATINPSGSPHLVPITFVLDGQRIYFAVDGKPKRTTDLQRLRNIAANPSVAILVDHYDEDWRSLWWVRVDGQAAVLGAGAETKRALVLLAERYAQYRQARPPGPVVAITITKITGWAAGDNPAC